jgi:hypothetical protein
MVHGQSTYFGNILANSRTAFGLFIRNRRRVITTLVGGYMVMASLLAFVVMGQYKPIAPQAQASGSALSATIKASTTVASLGDTVEVSLTLQNTALVSPIDELKIELLSTSNQLTIASASDGDTVLPLTSTGGFVLSSLSAQVTKQILITARVNKITSGFVGIYGHIIYQNSGELDEYSTNRIFVGLDGVALGGQYVELKSAQAEYKTADKPKLTARVNDQVSGEIKGSILTIQDGQVVREYECTLSAGTTCETELKDLKAGAYTSWFVSSNYEVFSALIKFAIVTETQQYQLAPTTSLVLPFGTTSVASRLPIVLKDVVNRNEKPITCRIELRKTGSDTIKNFDTISDLNRECSYWISTSELDGFGEYTLKAQGSTLEKTLVINDSVSTLPLAITTVVVVQGQPIALSSKAVVSTIAPIQPYTGSAELLIYNPTTRNIETITTLSSVPVAYTAGELSAEIGASYFGEGSLYYIATKITETSGPTTTLRYSPWTLVNFGSAQVDATSSGIEIEDLNQLKIGGKPVFVVRDIKDISGVVINDRPCSLRLYQQGITEPLTTTATITNGECRIILEDTAFIKTGIALATLYTADSSTSLAQSRVFRIASDTIRSIGDINLALSPAPWNTANTLILGPAKDTKDNLVTQGSLTIRLGQAKDSWIKEEKLTIKDGFGKISIPASMLDSKELYIQVIDKDTTVLSEKTFATTDQPVVSSKIPTTIESGDIMQVLLDKLPGDWLECSVTIKSIQDVVVTSPVDIASKTCLVRSDLPAQIGTKALVQVQYGTSIVTSDIDIIPGKAAQNFALYPQTRIVSSGDIQLALVTTPLVDAKGLSITSGEIALKLNGKDITQQVSGGYAKVALTADQLNTRDIKSSFGKRYLDIDVAGGLTVRARTTTDSLRVALGIRDLASTANAVKITRLSTAVPTNTVQLLQLQSQSCDTWLEEGSQYRKLESILVDTTCNILISSALEGNARLVIFEKGTELFSSTIKFASNAPLVVWSANNGVAAQILNDANYQIEATLLDGDKEYSYTDSIKQSISIKQQGLVDSLEYLVRIEATDTDGVTQYFYRAVQGSALR